jgi:hypothetical protein
MWRRVILLAGCWLLLTLFLARGLFPPWRWRLHFRPKRHVHSNKTQIASHPRRAHSLLHKSLQTSCITSAFLCTSTAEMFYRFVVRSFNRDCRAPRGTFGPTARKVTVDWRKLPNNKLNNMNSSDVTTTNRAALLRGVRNATFSRKTYREDATGET